MGQRDAGFSTPRQELQNPKVNQEEIVYRKKHITSRESRSSTDPIKHKEPIREVHKISTTRPKQKDHNSNDVEGSSSYLTGRHLGIGTGDQRGRKIDSVESGGKNDSTNEKYKNKMGRNEATGTDRSWNSGSLRDQVVCSPTSTMLQMPKIQSYIQHVSRKGRHLRSMRWPPPHKSLRRQAERKPRDQVTVQQLQGGPLHGEWAVPVPTRDGSQIKTSTSTATTSTSPDNSASQVSMDIQPSCHQIQNPFLTAQSTQIKSVISVPIKDFIHHYPRALFNDIPRVGTHFNDIPGSGQVPPLEEFPDTLQTTRSMEVRIPEGTNNIPQQDATQVQIVRTPQVPQAQTPQKKRQHSGAWRQIVRKQTNQQPSPPKQQLVREHIEQPHPEPLPSTSRHSHTTKIQTPINRPTNKECQMSVKDIVATSQLIMTMQQHLMSQMAEIQPNAYIHNIMKAISESMHEITAKVRILHWNAQGLNNPEKQSALVAGQYRCSNDSRQSHSS